MVVANGRNAGHNPMKEETHLLFLSVYCGTFLALNCLPQNVNRGYFETTHFRVTCIFFMLRISFSLLLLVILSCKRHNYTVIINSKDSLNIQHHWFPEGFTAENDTLAYTEAAKRI